jgi:hypothetical protein
LRGLYLRGSFDTENNNLQKLHIKITGSQTKYVEGFVFISFVSGSSGQKICKKVAKSAKK